jgi:hypothetical protein
MKRLLAVLTISLAGCNTVPDKIDPNYAVYVTSAKEVAVAEAAKAKEPLFRLKGVAGQTIKLEGVEELTIFMPETNGGRSAITFAPYVPPKNEAVEMVKAIGGIITPIGAILATGKATTDLATAVGNSANHGYQYVQAPQPNQTISGTGVIGSGSMTQNTVSGTGVIGDGTMTTNTLSGSGTMGAGAYTTNDLAGTGSIGGDYTDTHATTTSTTTTTDTTTTPTP